MKCQTTYFYSYFYINNQFAKKKKDLAGKLYYSLTWNPFYVRAETSGVNWAVLGLRHCRVKIPVEDLMVWHTAAHG